MGALEERAECCGYLTALDRRNKTGVDRIVVLHGGIAPAPRRRAVAALRLEEREEISRGIAVSRSLRQIAQGTSAPINAAEPMPDGWGSQETGATTTWASVC